jgi:hypothetical protein
VGLYSFVGKALKGVSKIAGFIPGVGGSISKITGAVGGILSHKAPMSRPMVTRPQVARGNVTASGYGYTAKVLRQTPIMPGGAIATPHGIAPQQGGAPPATYGGARPAAKKRRAPARRRAPAKRKTKRRATSRRLKFGSPAWRKKYMKKRR